MKQAFRLFLQMAVVATITLAVSSMAAAQQIKVATGSAKGTYSTMLKELQNVCSNEIPIVEVNTNGSMTNVDLLVNNQINGAWVQADVLHYRARSEELGHVKTLLAMHPEEVHFVALKDSGIKEGGVIGIGAQPVVFSGISHLANYRVGAAGGSYITAQVIRLQSQIPFQVVQYDDNAKLMDALNKRQIEAAVFVGGQPLGAVAELGPNYKLLNISEQVGVMLKGVYRNRTKGDKPVTLNYSKMGPGGTAIQSVSIDALFVTREYKTPRMLESLSRFRQCAQRAIPELQETTGTHPKWQAVDIENKGKWAWYDLPEAKPVTPSNAAGIAVEQAKEAAKPRKQ